MHAPNTRTLSKSSQFQRGQALLPTILVIATLLGLIGLTAGSSAYLQTFLSSQRASGEKALRGAYSGVYDALIRIDRDKTWTTEAYGATSPCLAAEYRLDTGTVTTCVKVYDSTSGTSTQRTIESRATVNAVARTVQVQVEVSSSGRVRVLSRQEQS